MPTNIIPAAIPQFSPANGMITGPTDGDPLLAASVNNAFIPLADRSVTAWAGIRGTRAAYHQFVCDDGANYYWAGMAAARSTTRAFGEVQIGDTIVSLGLTLAANSLYYIYARDVAGVWDIVGSTTAPDPYRRYMNGNEDYIFLSYFATDSGANPIPWSQWDTYYSFNEQQPVLVGGSSAAFLAIPLPQVPPWVELVTMNVRIVSNDAVNLKQVDLSKDGVNVHRTVLVGPSPVGVSIFQQSEMTVPCQPSSAGPFFRNTAGMNTVTAMLTGCYL